MLRAFLILALVLPAPHAESAATVQTPGATVGAALYRGRLITWGDRIVEWKLPELRSRMLAGERIERGEGGCVIEWSGQDWGVVTQEGVPFGNLVLRRAPGFKPEILDVNVQMHDCTSAELYGRRGIIVIHRYSQVRFYERPAARGERWPYREVYSIYTPSQEAGLLLAEDIDGDGRVDLFCGNYWMRAPESFELPWIEYAINTWHETPDSATMRFALIGRDLIVAQGHMMDARLSRFTAPADVHQIWNEQRLSDDLHLRRPHALAAEGEDFVVGENDGPDSRLIYFRSGRTPEVIGRTKGVHTAFLLRDRVLTIGAGEIEWWAISGAGKRPYR